MGPGVLRRVRILLVDERRAHRAEVARALGRLGHIVSETEDVLAANTLLEAGEPFDAAIVAAGSDRDRALDLIARLGSEAGCPVIAILDAEDPPFIREAAARGVFAYLTFGDICGGRLEGTIAIAVHRYAASRIDARAGVRNLGRESLENGGCRQIATLD